MLRMTVLIILGLLSIGAQAQLVHYADMARVAERPDVAAYEAQLAAAAGDTDALYALALSIEAQLDSAMAREHLLVATANYLAQARATPAVAGWLQQLAQREVQIFVAHEHAGHITPLPAYDPAAAARHALARHAQRDAAERMAASLTGGNGWAQAITHSRAGKTDAPVAADIYSAAVRGLNLAVLEQEVGALRAALVAQPELGAALIEAARRLKRPSLLADVVDYGRVRDARAALMAAQDIDATFDQLPIIRAAITRQDTATAGLHALASAAVHEPGLTPELLGHLHRPAVSRAAAAAIAQNASPDLVPYLLQQLDATEDADFGAALVLTLSLLPGPRAREALLDWSERRGAHNLLRDKIRRAYGNFEAPAQTGVER